MTNEWPIDEQMYKRNAYCYIAGMCRERMVHGHGRIDGWTWKDRRMDERLDSKVDRWIDGRVDGWMSGMRERK